MVPLPGPISVLFFLLAPGSVAVLVPYLLTRWERHDWYGWTIPARAAGALIVTGGLIVLVDSFRRFVVEGRGTPIPIAPPKTLVVGGWYRSVRNPMYVAVLALVVGQALLLGRFILLGYAAVVWVAFHAFVVLYEEPTLGRKFGKSYDVYRAAVPRWWPRRRL